MVHSSPYGRRRSPYPPHFHRSPVELPPPRMYPYVHAKDEEAEGRGERPGERPGERVEILERDGRVTSHRRYLSPHGGRTTHAHHEMASEPGYYTSSSSRDKLTTLSSYPRDMKVGYDSYYRTSTEHSRKMSSSALGGRTHAHKEPPRHAVEEMYRYRKSYHSKSVYDPGEYVSMATKEEEGEGEGEPGYEDEEVEVGGGKDEERGADEGDKRFVVDDEEITVVRRSDELSETTTYQPPQPHRRHHDDNLQPSPRAAILQS